MRGLADRLHERARRSIAGPACVSIEDALDVVAEWLVSEGAAARIAELKALDATRRAGRVEDGPRASDRELVDARRSLRFLARTTR